MEKYNELRVLVENLEDDMMKFYEKGNKAAGTRVRKTLQDVKKLAQDVRIEIQNMKKS